MAAIDPLALNAGDLRHHIVILYPAPVSGPSGTSVAWGTFASMRASIKALKSSDIVKSGQDVSQLYLTIKFRWITGITSAMRVQSASGS